MANFGVALEAMLTGKSVRISGEKRTFSLVRDGNGKPHDILVKNYDSDNGWNPTTRELLSNDWEVA